jgi:hypothetical protein
VTTTPASRITAYAEKSKRLVTQAGGIVQNANKEISEGTFDFAQWATSARQLVDLALTASLELAPQMMPIPCLPESSEESDLSDFIEVAPDNECERVLFVAKTFVQDGASSYAIPDQLIVFVPAILPVYAKQFRVGVNWPDLRSGTYRGQVRLTRINAATERDTVMGVIIDL